MSGYARITASLEQRLDRDETVPERLYRYPPADLSAREFEDFVGGLFRSLPSEIENLDIQVRKRLEGPDGTYEIDVVVTYELAGLAFLVLVEAKHHQHPIKREDVQILREKVQSVGAHKGVLFSTSRFQQGALKFAAAHGIALVSLTEGRFTIETKAVEEQPPLSREEAARLFNLPTFVGHAYVVLEDGRVQTTAISPTHPESVKESLLPKAVPAIRDTGKPSLLLTN